MQFTFWTFTNLDTRGSHRVPTRRKLSPESAILGAYMFGIPKVCLIVCMNTVVVGNPATHSQIRKTESEPSQSFSSTKHKKKKPGSGWSTNANTTHIYLTMRCSFQSSCVPMWVCCYWVLAFSWKSVLCAAENAPRYRVDVVATYIQRRRRKGSTTTDCSMYAPTIANRIDQDFADAGEDENSIRRRELRNETDTTHPTPSLNVPRKLTNCRSFCHKNGYAPHECFYWSEGKCSGHRVLAAGDSSKYPETVLARCERRKKIMRDSLRNAATREVSLSTECRGFFSRNWDYRCQIYPTKRKP